MTMDAAAKTIESLSKHILPQKPHHLSFHEDWRYRPPSADAKDQEEWNNPRMQYLTMLSEADRGLLLTRPDYDMREELVKPAPRDVSDIIRGSVEKKKLSLSDYKIKKTAATSTSTSASPPEPLATVKKEAERALDARKQDRQKPRDSDPPTVEMKQRPPREPIVDMRLPPKPPTPKNPMPHFPRLTSPNLLNRKRVTDVEEESRPSKRPRPETVRAGEAKPRPPRDDVQRRKDRPNPAISASKDAPLPREDKPSITSSSTLLNGKATLKNAANVADHASPTVRPQSESLNGSKPSMAHNAKSLSIKAESKHDPSHKSSLPPLLSPLNLGLPFEDGDDDRANSKLDGRDRKRRDEARDRPRSPKQRRPEAPPTTSRRQRSPPRIPPLLSPTLPPAVEAALELSKMTTLDSLEAKGKTDKDALNKKKKSKLIKKEDADEDDAPQKPQRKTLIVTLKLPSGMRLNSKREFVMSSSSFARKEAPQRDHERSTTDDAAHPAQARKRPVVSAEAPSETIALKKPRATDNPGNSRPPVPPAPSTPSKKGTAAMSRVSSSNSLAQTPGDAIPARPSTAATTVDRRVNGSNNGFVPEGGPAAKMLREKEFKFLALGRKLKHEADLMMKTDRSHPGGGGASRDANPKLGYVLSVESLLAFIAGFHAQNLHRLMSNKKCDPTVWLTLFPFMDFIQDNIRRHELQRRFLPLYSLHLLLHAVAVDELLKCYAALDNPGAVKIEEVLRLERTRSRIWPQIRDTNEQIEHRELRVDVHPWTSLDEITVLSGRILKRWCLDEKVSWTMDSSLREPVGGKGGGQHS